MSSETLQPDAMDYFVTFSVSIMGSVIIVIFILLLKCIYCSMSRQDFEYEQQKRTYSHYLSILTIFFYSLVGIFTSVAFINISLTYHNKSGISYIFTRLAIFSWELGLFCMLCTFSYRVRSSFRDSFLQLSSCQNKMIYSLCLMIFFFGISIMIAIMLKWYWLRDILGAMSGLTFIVLCISLMVLFINRIDQIMFAKYEQCTEDSTEKKYNYNRYSFHIDHDLINLIVRHAILVSVAICSSFAGFIGSIIIPKFNDNGRYPVFSYFVIVSSVLVDTFSMYLLFSFAEGCYNKMCCHIHHCCKRCKVNQMERKYELNETQLNALRNSILLEIQLKPVNSYIKIHDHAEI